MAIHTRQGITSVEGVTNLEPIGRKLWKLTVVSLAFRGSRWYNWVLLSMFPNEPLEEDRVINNNNRSYSGVFITCNTFWLNPCYSKWNPCKAFSVVHMPL